VIEPAPGRREAWLDIDLAALRHNVATIRSLAEGAAVAAVVKADAYGHGLTAVVDALADDVDAFCVATLDEALAVRAQYAGRVLLLYPVPPAAVAEAASAGIELSVMSPADLETLRATAIVASTPVRIHLCLESGLGRGGLTATELLEVAPIAASDPRIELAGLWSHLAAAEDVDSAYQQRVRFDAAAAALAERGVALPPRHLAASGSLFAGTAEPYDLVRVGLSVYGVLDPVLPIPAARQAAAAALLPVMSLSARAVAISDIDVGDGVGYGSRWRAERPSRVAILPVGYADGYARSSQPGAEALVRGRRVPLVGIISMDSLGVDVTDIPGLSHDEPFVLLGRQGGEAISAADLARARNTIAWEVLSSMAPRLARVYHR
jgi:alanine racemase